MTPVPTLQAKPAPPARPSQFPSGRSLLQRKCACGGTPGPSGECEECRKKRESNDALRHTPNHPSENSPAIQETLRSPGHDFGQMSAYGPNQAARVPSAPTNSFEDCPADWQKKANAALAHGRPWVANVITGLVNLPSPVPAPVAALLNRHFHTTQPNHIQEIVRHFNTIYSAMNAPIDFECETSCDANVAAYVYSIWTDLHLCPVWYGLSTDGQANTIIHEIAHDAANRDDEAYVWQPKYATLSPADAIDNADSYSNFAEEASRP